MRAMGDPFIGAGWSMGYTQPLVTSPRIRAADDGDFEVPGNDRSWWDQHLDSSISAGLENLRWHLSEIEGSRCWGVSGDYTGRGVSVRIPRLLEQRDGLPVTDEVIVDVESCITDPRLGSWVIEAPSKWFRARRGWALNRPKFTTADPWFDQHAGCWAWDCADGPQALRDSLSPRLPLIREVLDSYPGAIITNTTTSAWIPYAEMTARLPEFLSMVTRALGPE